MQSAITTKGQITIPKPIRDHLGLKPGDKVKFFIRPDGSVVLLPVRPISGLRGRLESTRRKPVTIEEMREAMLAGASGRFHRAKGR